jgi:D-alanine-D-alanine ligase-like ATP-grasp enzyme
MRSGALRELVTRVDVARSTGSRHALRRLSQDVRHARGERVNRAVARSMWSAAAQTLGAEAVELGDGFFEIKREGSWTRVYEQTVPLNDEVSVRVADNKALIYRLLQAAGIRMPHHLEFSPRELPLAIEFLERAQTSCVVKPVRSSSGFGVTSQIREPADLRRAVRWAARFSNRLFIEHQCGGCVYRVLVLDGTVLDAVRQNPPSVTGDGRSTLAELVEAEYERRLRSGGIGTARPFVIDLDAILTLRRDGLSPHAVPEAGTEVRVKTVTNQNRFEDNETALDSISDALAAEAVAAASVAGLRLAGVDLVTQDARLSLADGEGAVIDVNPHPGLWHHYHVRDPSSATDVAAEILRRLLVASL